MSAAYTYFNATARHTLTGACRFVAVRVTT